IEAGKKQLLTDLGVKVLILPVKEGKVDLNSLLKALYEENIDSVLVEGGGRVNGSFLTEGLFDKVYAYIGGMLLGGEGKTPIAGNGVALNEAIRLVPSDIKCFDNDVLIEYRVFN
ncbi:MAG: RibD family protein, partial [Lachnospiraceae bacterium]|nr:RibD family protein [Lachnospiraceae bacterium]